MLTLPAFPHSLACSPRDPLQRLSWASQRGEPVSGPLASDRCSPFRLHLHESVLAHLGPS